MYTLKFAHKISSPWPPGWVRMDGTVLKTGLLLKQKHPQA